MEIKGTGQDGTVIAPGSSPSQKEVIDHLVCECLAELLAIAKRLLWKYKIHPSRLVAQGAVDGALIQLYGAIAAGTIREFASRADFLRAFHLMLGRYIRDEKKRQNAQKRGGSWQTGGGRHSGPLRVDQDPDAIASSAPGPEELFDAEDTVKWLLALLDPYHSSFRWIATQSMCAVTNEKIAEELGVLLSTVERGLRKIRSIWKAYDPTPRRARRAPSRS